MSTISENEKNIFEDLFEMETGYVMDLSNPKFARFVSSIVQIDIYNGPGYEEYCSKANKLRQIWETEPDGVVGTLLDALISYYENYKTKYGNSLDESQKKKIEKCQFICQRLLLNGGAISLPIADDETLQILLGDINRSIAANQPTLVLDRLHTFSTRFLRKTCTDNKIPVADENGNYFSLNSLAGSLRQLYEKDSFIQSRFSLIALRNSVSLFDQYNYIRNNQSYAHDNDVLDDAEAYFAVNSMKDILVLINNIETSRRNRKSPSGS